MPNDRIRILAVDDDATFLDDLAGLLESRYVLTRAAGGKQALEALARAPIDAVLLDLDLGRGADGFEILEQIRRLEPNLPVIIVTKDASSASAVAALKKGASDYEDGLSLLSHIRRQCGWKLPVVVLTREDEIEIRGRALSRGANAFLSAPVDVGELDRVVRELLPAGEPQLS